MVNGNGFIMNSEAADYKENLLIKIDLIHDKQINYDNKNPAKFLVIFKSKNKDLFFNKRLIVGYELVFDIRKPSGKNIDLKYDLYVGSPDKNDFILLEDGKKFSVVIDLADDYTLDEKGIYTVKAVYKNQYDGKEFGLKAWTGKIESNILEFKIGGKRVRF